jgi:hypothetical protein
LILAFARLRRRRMRWRRRRKMRRRRFVFLNFLFFVKASSPSNAFLVGYRALSVASNKQRL